MSVKNENAAGGESVVLERPAAGGVYASLFEKINLNPVSELSALDIWQDAQAMSDATADERLTAGMQVTTPLSVMLNPYRPLPLAGVVFSQPSAGAERAVAHHWGMDKRWEALPESVRMLPAALRPVKPGISWRGVLASAAALMMVSWAVWMSIAYVTNRSQIAGANTQASLAARQNQPLEQRLHALSELQKTLARLQYRSEHGVPWYERAGLSQNNALLAALWPR